MYRSGQVIKWFEHLHNILHKYCTGCSAGSVTSSLRPALLARRGSHVRVFKLKTRNLKHEAQTSKIHISIPVFCWRQGNVRLSGPFNYVGCWILEVFSFSNFQNLYTKLNTLGISRCSTFLIRFALMLLAFRFCDHSPHPTASPSLPGPKQSLPHPGCPVKAAAETLIICKNLGIFHLTKLWCLAPERDISDITLKCPGSGRASWA